MSGVPVYYQNTERLVSLRQSDAREQQERQYRQQKILEVESHVVPRNAP